MNILLTGASGQVGYELQRSLQPLGRVVALERSQLDLSDLDQVRDVVRALRPGLIVNSAAYTAVDLAESEPALAHCINAAAPAVMAEEARLLGAAMVHFSSDYVFDGAKQGAYVETDPTGPLNVYGKSKLAGDQAIIASGVPHLILRTSWVYGMRGNNFLKTMLRLGAERTELKIVDDQFGAPTWSRSIADITAVLLAHAASGGNMWWEQYGGLYHVSCQGHTSWHGFAQAIAARARLDCQLTPIGSIDYPTPAARPRNSVMSSDKLIARFCAIPEWEHALSLCMG